jgi:hypothetical protein
MKKGVNVRRQRQKRKDKENMESIRVNCICKRKEIKAKTLRKELIIGAYHVVGDVFVVRVRKYEFRTTI